MNKRVNATSHLATTKSSDFVLPMLQGRRFQVHSFERDVQALNGHNSRYHTRRNTLLCSLKQKGNLPSPLSGKRQ